MKKSLLLFMVTLICLFIFIPKQTIEAVSKKPFQKFKGDLIYNPYVDKNGSLVCGYNTRANKADLANIVIISDRGEVTKKWKERGLGLFTSDAKQSKRQIYVYDSTKGTLKTFDQTHKKKWQRTIAKGVKEKYLGFNGGFFYDEPRYDYRTHTKGFTYNGKAVTFPLRNYDENGFGLDIGRNDQFAYDFDYDYNGSFASLSKWNGNGTVAWSRDIFKMDKNKGSKVFNYHIFQDDEQGNVYIRVGYSKYEGKKDVILLYALSSSGELIWKKNVNQSETRYGNIIGDTFFYTEYDKAVFLNRKNGKTISTIKTYDYVRLHAIEGNTLYLSYGNYLTAVTEKGKIIWKYKIPKGKTINEAKVDQKRNTYIAISDKSNIHDFVKVSANGKQVKKYTYNALNDYFIDIVINSKSGVIYPLFNKYSNNEKTVLQYRY